MFLQFSEPVLGRTRSTRKDSVRVTESFGIGITGASPVPDYRFAGRPGVHRGRLVQIPPPQEDPHLYPSEIRHPGQRQAHLSALPAHEARAGLVPFGLPGFGVSGQGLPGWLPDTHRPDAVPSNRLYCARARSGTICPALGGIVFASSAEGSRPPSGGHPPRSSRAAVRAADRVECGARLVLPDG